MHGEDSEDWAQAQTLGSDEHTEPAERGEAQPGEDLRRRLQESGRGPPRVGRFFIQREIGAGGMGAVFAGIDPELDRRVAVKLVQHDPKSDRARVRLRREAQALAQLSHPNVVPVFEVGEHDGHTFVAMELVVGQNLRDWLDADLRDWREILDVFRQAGEGLAAAHEAGLVHRDFKPHNVLVGDDGRVRVVDFGLATDDSQLTPAVATDDGTTSVNVSLTRTGELLGTPAYMAPEQFAGEPVTPASDQFAFCVALFDALAGSRPFSGDSVHDLSQSLLQGAAEALPPGTYPAEIGPLIERGLTREPSRRHSSMRDLLDALREAAGDAPPRERSRWTAAFGVATVALAGALAWTTLGDRGDDSAGVAKQSSETQPPVEEATRATPPPAAPVEVSPPPVPPTSPVTTPPPPPDGEAPTFRGVTGPRADEALDSYQQGCEQFAQGHFVGAARSFALAQVALPRAGGDPVDVARIQYHRALAHRSAWVRDGRANDLNVAYELLYRLHEAESPVADDPTVRNAVESYEALLRDDALADIGIDPTVPSRFAVAFFDQGEPGAEVSIDGVIIGHEPVTGAVPVDKGGHVIIGRHPRFYDSFTMWNPPNPGYDHLNRSPMALVPPGEKREDQVFPPFPGLPKLPEQIARPEDWPL